MYTGKSIRHKVTLLVGSGEYIVFQTRWRVEVELVCCVYM